MYHILLTNRYLTTRVIPLIAVAAVALCVALVIIVVSVMSGFLDMVKQSGRTLMGDVVVSYPVSGIPRYDELIDRIEALPEAAAATPVVDNWGLLRMPYPSGPNKQIETVQFWAIDPASFSRVTGFEHTLYWRPPTPEQLDELDDRDFRMRLREMAGEQVLQQTYQQALQMRHDPPEGDPVPGAVLGMHVSIGNERQRDGSYTPVFNGLSYWWMPQYEVILTTVPVGTAAVAPEPENARLQVVNEFVSGVFLIDDKRIFVPLETGQRLLHLDEEVEVDDEGEETGRIYPPRATMILVRAADGVTPEQLRPLVAGVFETFRRDLYDDAEVATGALPPREGGGVLVQTWLQQQAQFIAPIEKERELMRVLFSIVYLVCAGLVLSIFWAIVYEKTRDIGILRSIGASRLGISAIFLRYGAIIGAAGSVVGLGLAFLVIHNINWIHNALGEDAPWWLWAIVFAAATVTLAVTIWRVFRGLVLPVVLWALLTLVLVALGFALMFHRGTLIWDPSVYYFSEIPNNVDVFTAVTTMIGAVVFSVLGAFLPAAKAADTDPVRALRYE
jgi:lipoprotein-releasing system permease protein